MDGLHYLVFGPVPEEGEIGEEIYFLQKILLLDLSEDTFVVDSIYSRKSRIFKANNCCCSS